MTRRRRDVTLDRPERINALTFEVYARAPRRRSARSAASPTCARSCCTAKAPRGFCSGGDVERHHRRALRARHARAARVHAHDGRARPRDPDDAAARRRVAPRRRRGRRRGDRARVRRADRAHRTRASRSCSRRSGLSGADMGAAYLLPRIVGLGRASELLFTGDFVDATSAPSASGWSTAWSARSSVHDEARALAQPLADGPAFAHAMTKRMLDYEATRRLRRRRSRPRRRRRPSACSTRTSARRTTRGRRSGRRGSRE